MIDAIEDDHVWFELRPYPNFEDNAHLTDVVSKAQEFAIFFVRSEFKTIILARIPSFQQALFKKIDLVEAISIPKPNFRFEHVSKLWLQQNFCVPFTLEVLRHGLYSALEQIGKTCIVACYARRDDGIRSKIHSWITKKEAIKTLSSQTKSNVELAKKKATLSDFFQVDLFFGVEEKITFDILQQGVPRGISRMTYFPQSKYSYTRFSFKPEPFVFEDHIAHKGLFNSPTYPLLCGPELHSIIALPENVSKLSIIFGKHQTYSHGPQIDAKEVESLFDPVLPANSNKTEGRAEINEKKCIQNFDKF